MSTRYPVQMAVRQVGVKEGRRREVVQMRLWSSYQASWKMNRTMERKETLCAVAFVF
jgi:hypothetical protein